MEHRWCVFPVSDPGTTAAIIAHRARAGEPGSVEVEAPDPAMRALVLYFLTDPMAASIIGAPGAEWNGPPHTRWSAQVHLRLQGFHTRYTAYQVERVPGAGGR